MSDPLHVHFEDIDNGQVLQLGAIAVDEAGRLIFSCLTRAVFARR